MQIGTETDWFELCLDRYPDLPSVVLIRSVELKNFPRNVVEDPVLDLCCGDGFFTTCLGLRGVYGCDIDERAVDRAARTAETYRRAVTCDARDLTAFADGSFRTVFSNCALEHVRGVDRALASAARVLKPGGRLLMSVPDASLNELFAPGLFFRAIGFSGYGRRLCGEYNRKQEHVNIHAFELWREKLEHAGLAVEKKFYLFSEREYKLITFFESFVMDLFPGNIFRLLYTAFKRSIPASARKALWRKLLKPVYRTAGPRRSGGELFIVARRVK